MKITAFAILPLALFTAHSTSANLVSNPSFEDFTGTFASDGGRQLVVSSTTLTNWSVTNGEIALLKTPNSYSLTPSDGNYFIDLAGYSNTGFPKGISQTLSGLAIGQAYHFSMDVGLLNGTCGVVGNRCGGPIQVSATIGSASQTFTNNSTSAGNIWQSYGFDFSATNASMSLTIKGVSLPAGDAYIGLDNVAVNAVPLPATTWLFSSSLLGLTGFACRRRAD